MTYSPNCKPINTLALAMGRYLTARELEVNPHPDLERAARKAYALVDWVETEIDPRTHPIEFEISTCLFHLGQHLGFKMFESLTDAELDALGVPA